MRQRRFTKGVVSVRSNPRAPAAHDPAAHDLPLVNPRENPACLTCSKSLPRMGGPLLAVPLVLYKLRLLLPQACCMAVAALRLCSDNSESPSFQLFYKAPLYAAS